MKEHTMRKYTKIHEDLADVLCRYVAVIRSIEYSRGNACYTKALNAQRSIVHDEILKICGKSRDDDKFTFELAEFCEDYLMCDRHRKKCS